MNITTAVKHSESKIAWNVIGTTLGAKYKVAIVPYFHELEKEEAKEIAEFISKSFNDAKEQREKEYTSFEIIWNSTVEKFASLPTKCSWGWVSIENDLPPIEQDVLVSDGFATYISNRLDNEGIVWDESVYKLDKVTHWMFLPEKP